MCVVKAEIKETRKNIHGWIPAQYPPIDGIHKVRVMYDDDTEDCAYWFNEGKLFAWDPNKLLPITHYKLAQP